MAWKPRLRKSLGILFIIHTIVIISKFITLHPAKLRSASHEIETHQHKSPAQYGLRSKSWPFEPIGNNFKDNLKMCLPNSGWHAWEFLVQSLNTMEVINLAKVGQVGFTGSFASLSKLNKLAIRGLNIQWQDLSHPCSQVSVQRFVSQYWLRSELCWCS